MYGIGHVCQSVMYLGSVYCVRHYSRYFELFQMIFQWSEMLTLMASMLYVYHSVKVLQRRKERQLMMQKQREQQGRFREQIRINADVVEWVMATS